MKFTTLLSIGLLALPTTLLAQAGQVVGPNGTSTLGDPTNWSYSQQGLGSAQVTTTLPCGTATIGPCSAGYGNVGSGSLELSVTGNGNTSTGYADWAFYYLYAGGSAANTVNTGASFGNLAQLSALSFDWYRTGLSGWDAPVGSVQNINDQPITPADWAYKTPVLRLQLREYREGKPDVLSELVWEGYYNQCALGADQVNCANNKTAVNEWVTQGQMQLGNFWYVSPPAQNGTAGYSQNGSCASQMSFWEGGVNANNAANLFSQNGCLFGANVEVIGIAVGVGSQWPLPWHGAVDNVRMGFGTGEDYRTAVNANFDFVPVPEPSSIALLGLGIAGLAAARRRRMKR